MTGTVLHRLDPARNMARFCRVDVTRTLFDEARVERSWGRIGTCGRTTLETCATTQGAEASAARTLRAKLKRGYPAIS